MNPVYNSNIPKAKTSETLDFRVDRLCITKNMNPISLCDDKARHLNVVAHIHKYTCKESGEFEESYITYILFSFLFILKETK